MKNNNRKELFVGMIPFIFACIYIFSIIMFDYTPIYVVAALLLLITDVLFIRKKKFIYTALFITYLILLLYFAIHTLLGFSVAPVFSYAYLATMALNLVIIFATDNAISSNETIEKIMKAYVYSSLITCSYILIADRANILTGNLGIGAKKPFFGTTYAHNDVSMAAAYSTAFLAYFSASGKKMKFGNIFKIFFSIFVLLTGARKSLILVIFSLVIYPLVFSNRDKDLIKKGLKIGVCILLLMAVIFLILNNNSLYEIIGYRFEGFINGLVNGGNYTESSAVSRSVMLDTALRLFKNNPIVGYGLNTFRTFKGSYGTWSHNNYLELAVSGGILASCIYYGLFVYIFVKLRRLPKTPMSGLFKTIMIFMIIHDFLSISYITRMTLFIIGLACVFIKNNDKVPVKDGNE